MASGSAEAWSMWHACRVFCLCLSTKEIELLDTPTELSYDSETKFIVGFVKIKNVMEASTYSLANGKRLGKITNSIPKPLIKINNKSFLDILLSKVITYNFKNIYLLCSYKKNLAIYEGSVVMILFCLIQHFE